VFLEAERNFLRRSIANLEVEIAQSQRRLEKKQQELAAIEAQLP
jgi:septal ring factor EnvC (AmiA/AmiB activator)